MRNARERRRIVTLFAALSGFAASFGYVAIAMRGIVKPPVPAGAPFRSSPEEDLMIFEACIVFFSVIYAVGAACYRWAGARDEFQTVVGAAEQHLPLLYLAGSAEMLSMHLPKVWIGTARPGDWLALGVGVVLLVVAIIGLRRAIQKYQPFGIGRPRIRPLDKPIR